MNSGREYEVALILGDGIGPEISGAAVAVLEATGVSIRWREFAAGEAARQRHGHPLPAATLAAVRTIGVALKGPLLAPTQTGRLVVRHGDADVTYPSVNNALRRELEVFANVRPIRSFPGVPTPFSSLDVVIVREVTEDTYIGWEEMKGPDEAWAIKRITRQASERIFRFAFEYARARGRRKVTAGHKANVLNLTDGLFLESGRNVAARFPDLAFDDCMIDALCLRLVLGLAPGANIGARVAFFEAAHGAAPDIVGQGIANPIALILSGAMLLGHLGEAAAERRIWEAVARVLREGRHLTPDLGGHARTTDVTRAIIAALGRAEGVTGSA
ncbi:MAG: isocitrate/isopropylmalate dehydrogenase family protein [candidate division NC10 bacterium]|nr:isocitrate/isopropylmalate dehydrogenase family protein [candidate division NC10 bacterium]